LSGGNMQGSCEPPGPGQIWSAYQLRPDIPQALTTGIRPCQRPSHRRRSARLASISEISMRNALA
jgi:hypothetical protein